MSFKQLIKITISALRHPRYTAQILGTGSNSGCVDIRQNIRLGADWLLKAQENSADGDGYSRRFSLVSGWDRGYIETTGYIIPTLLDVANFLDEPQYRESAIKAGEWLLTVQSNDGAFTDIDDYERQVFDTGQVMLGLNRMFRETKDELFLGSARKAARWLVDGQEKNGSWLRFSYGNHPHAYYSRVAAALIETGLLAKNDEFVERGRLNLDWVLSLEQENGHFKHSEFEPGTDALLHTIVYVLEGFSMAFNLTGEQKWRETFIRGATVLKQLVNEELLLYSQYDPDWNATNKEYCVTGLAQYAGICLDVHRITGDHEFQHLGASILEHLCSWQQQQGRDTVGALPSSIPAWGCYGGMAFFNWNIKFFLDAALKAYSNETNVKIRTD